MDPASGAIYLTHGAVATSVEIGLVSTPPADRDQQLRRLYVYTHSSLVVVVLEDSLYVYV